MKKGHAVGIDILKIIAMWMIVSIHALNHGGILDILTAFSGKYYAVYAYYALTFVANDVFVLISGYFLVNQNFRRKKAVSLWMQMAFYTWIGAGFIFLYDGIYLHNGILRVVQRMIPFLFPVSGGVYWFFSCYMILYLISPVLNYALKNAKKEILILGVMISSVICGVIDPFLQILCGRDIFGIKRGQSLIFFILLYLIGGLIRLNGNERIKKLRASVCILSGLTVIVLLPLFKFFIDFISRNLIGRQVSYADMLYCNSSIPVLVAAIMFLLAGICYKCAWKQKTLGRCSAIAELTGEVYLFHENYAWYMLIWNFIDYPGRQFTNPVQWGGTLQ